MNKSDLIEAVSKTTNVSKSNTTRVIETCLAVILKTLKGRENIRLTGFGTFTISKRKARKGRNPRTGEAINIPAKSVPKFSPGLVLKRSVNQS